MSTWEWYGWLYLPDGGTLQLGKQIALCDLLAICPALFSLKLGEMLGPLGCYVTCHADMGACGT